MKELSALQAAVMRELWDRGELTVAEVHERLASERSIALNTVATVLARLAKDGVVSFRKSGRRYVYRADLAETDARRSMVGNLVHRLFEDDAAALVGHLVREGEFARDELDALESIIQKRKLQMRDDRKEID